MKSTLTTREYRILLELIFRLRTASGLTQQQLAEKLGVPQSFISKVENGERTLDFIELFHLCNALGCDIEDFAKEFNTKLYASK